VGVETPVGLVATSTPGGGHLPAVQSWATRAGAVWVSKPRWDSWQRAPQAGDICQRGSCGRHEQALCGCRNPGGTRGNEHPRRGTPASGAAVGDTSRRCVGVETPVGLVATSTPGGGHLPAGRMIRGRHRMLGDQFGLAYSACVNTPGGTLAQPRGGVQRLVNDVEIRSRRFVLSGYIGEFEVIDDHRSGKVVIELVGRINKCGVISPRFDLQIGQIEQWTSNLLPSRQFGYIVMTTSLGIMDHEEVMLPSDASPA